MLFMLCYTLMHFNKVYVKECQSNKRGIHRGDKCVGPRLSLSGFLCPRRPLVKPEIPLALREQASLHTEKRKPASITPPGGKKCPEEECFDFQRSVSGSDFTGRALQAALTTGRMFMLQSWPNPEPWLQRPQAFVNSLHNPHRRGWWNWLELCWHRRKVGKHGHWAKYKTALEALVPLGKEDKEQHSQHHSCRPTLCSLELATSGKENTRNETPWNLQPCLFLCWIITHLCECAWAVQSRTPSHPNFKRQPICAEWYISESIIQVKHMLLSDNVHNSAVISDWHINRIFWSLVVIYTAFIWKWGSLFHVWEDFDFLLSSAQCCRCSSAGKPSSLCEITSCKPRPAGWMAGWFPLHIKLAGHKRDATLIKCK